MRLTRKFALFALLFVQLLVQAHPTAASDVRIVKAPVSLKVLDWNGKPIQTTGGFIRFVLSDFGSAWDRKYWVTMSGAPDDSGAMTVMADVPVSPSYIRKAVQHAKGRTQFELNLGFQVLDVNSQPLHLDNGLLLIITGIGQDPWPAGTEVRVRTVLNTHGYTLTKVQFPLNHTIMHNFLLMADDRRR